MLPVIWVTASSDLAVGWAEADLPSLGLIEGVLWEVVLFIVERRWGRGFGQWSCGSLLLVVGYFILSFILRTGPVSCAFILILFSPLSLLPLCGSFCFRLVASVASFRHDGSGTSLR